MKIWNNIVQSETEPSVKSIWFKNNRLWFYNNGIWDPLTDEIGKAPDLSGYLKRQEFTSFTEDLLTSYGRLKQKRFPYVLVSTVTWQNTLSNPISYSDYDNQMTFMVNIFHDRPLDSRSKSSYNLVTERGLASAIENVAHIAYLNIGDSAEIKAHNQAQLPTDGSSFLTCIDQGVGTGRFIQGNGGSATITTADGIRVHYKINVDYSVVKDSTHFDHSELFYYRGEIGLNDISGTTTTPVNYEITDPLVRDSLLRASNFCFDLVVGENKFRVACPCVSIGLTEKVWRSPDIKVGNTNWNYVEFTLRKLENGSYQLSMKAI